MAKALILKSLIDKLGVPIAKFERKIGVTATSIAKALERNSGIKDYTIEKIVKAYPNVREEWLQTGIGPMFKVEIAASMPLPIMSAAILSKLIDELEMPVAKFERMIGAAQGTISKQIERNSDLKVEIVQKIMSAFPNVNREWLMSGKGPVFLDLQATLSKPKEVIEFGKRSYSRMKPEDYAAAYEGWEGVPMYNTAITASFVETYRDENNKTITPFYYLHDPRFKDCNFGAVITGDSMHSEIRHGDFVLCKEITDLSFFIYGEIYYVVTTNGMETCKYLNADPKDENNVLLVPKNGNISPSPVPKSKILKLFKVRGIIRGY